MADALGAFSLASDLAMGLHAEHGARSCYIGMHIAQELGLSEEQRSDLFYAELLKDAGCTTWTSQLAGFWLADELNAKKDLQFFRNSRDPLDVASWLLKFVAAGAPLPTRAAHILDSLVRGREFMREGFESTCLVAARIAQRLGMPRAVQEALMQVFEQWDGHGMPYGVKGDAITIVSRIVLMTSLLEVFHRVEGREGAKSLALAQRGRALDPSAVDAFLALAQRDAFWSGLEHERVWDAALALEPESSPHRYMGEDRLMDLGLAMADYVDLKSPFLAGHSHRVADLAVRISRRMSSSERRITTIRMAALVHDIGLVAVPSFVLNKPEARLTPAEWEQVRLHPYHSERILSKVPNLRPLLPIVAAHHERLDGQGYHIGLPGAQIPPEAQIIAVADRFDELSHDQPDRHALDPDEAVAAMREEVGIHLAADAFEALVEELEGVRQRPRKRGRKLEWPAGLTDREVEVLRLVARGLNRREAAKALFVSENTIRSHLEHIYGKIGVPNRAAATLFAIEHDLLP